MKIPDTKECVSSHTGAWACESKAFNLMYQRVMDGIMPMLSQSELDDKKNAKLEYKVYDGIAVIEMVGASQKAESKYNDSFSTVRTRRLLRHAKTNDAIKGVMLFISSPGGTVAGQNELGMEIASVAKIKPIRAYGEDMVASAAMWSASQVDSFSCNPTASVGCIGTYSVVYDYSGAAKKDGIKVHLIATGDYKGAGVPGTEITDKHLKEWHRNVDILNEFFLEAVSSGRNISMANLKNIADGRSFIAAEAMELGLVDKIESWDEAMMNFADSIEEAEINQLELKTQERVMENEQVKLFATVFGNERGMDYLSREMSFEDAATEHITMQGSVIDGLKSENQELIDSVSAKNAKIKELGKDIPLEPDNSTPPQEKSGKIDPVGDWKQAVQEKVDSGISASDAEMAVIKENPEIYSAYVEALN